MIFLYDFILITNIDELLGTVVVVGSDDGSIKTYNIQTQQVIYIRFIYFLLFFNSYFMFLVGFVNWPWRRRKLCEIRS